MEDDYRSICNTVTLQSDKRGFFLELAETVEAAAGESWVARFKVLPSHRARIEACLGDPKVSHIVHGTLSKVQQIFRGKTQNFAKSKMEEGEHWFRKGKTQRALTSVNLAVVRAPLKDPGKGKDVDLTVAPLSLWLRSEILYSMGEYKCALTDIQLALKYHLPNKYKAEAYKRMGMCYLNIGERKKACVSLNVAQSSGNKELQEECTEILDHIEAYLITPHENKIHPLVTSSLPGMPGISSAVKLHTDSACGRHFKAVEPIAINDVVVSEEPYVSALRIEKHGTHCLHCFSRLKFPIPCPSCSGVGFCSMDCCTEGLKYHRWECPYLELEMGSGMSILSHLALRIITQNDLGFFKTAVHKDQKYQQLLKLEGHLKERDGQDLVRRTLMTLFLLQILRHGGYFGSKNDKGNDKSDSSTEDSDEEGIGKLSEDEITIGCLLLTHLVVLQYNTHEVFETIISSGKNESFGRTNYIGLALYLNTSFFNHQCEPMLARYFTGKKIILRALRPISIGEDVCENYGPIFTIRTKEQRQKTLNGRYLFNCNCKACVMDWPKLDAMPPETAFFRCKQKQCPGSVDGTGLCQVCGNKQSLKKDLILFRSYQEEWESAAKLVIDKKYKEAEEILIHYVENMWRLVSQPSKNLNLAMDSLRTIWNSTSGNSFVINT